MEAIKKKFNFENIKHMWSENPVFSTGIALLVMIALQTAALGFNYPSFMAWLDAWVNNMLNILRNNASVGIIALGMTFVIISGGIELSVGSMLVAISAVLMLFIDGSATGILTSIGITGLPAYIIGIIVALAMGILLGTGTGLLISKGKIPPFIATLGTMKIFRSVTQHFMQSVTPTVPAGFLNIANYKIGGRYLLPIIYWIIAALILAYVAKKTRFGRRIFAIGSNQRAAKLSGINVDRVRIGIYTLIGFLVAIASVLQVARIGSMDFANAGSGYEMDAIAAVIVGGTSMSGGRGSIAGTVLGTLIIAVMNNLLNLLGVPPFLREAFKGLIVVFAVLLQKKEQN
ncbi:ABC transporter permease [Erysipelothrix sp. HDW6C]|nr:ABC transporter permease [Erysipelothrix sp. HDW6C]